MLWDYSVIPLGVAFNPEMEDIGFYAAVTLSMLHVSMKFATIGAVDTLM